MKSLGLLSQFLAIGIAIAIVLLFVRPTFTEIGETQNEIQQYSEAREQVTQTNQTLAARVAELESIAISDRQRIATYMPTTLDEVAVLRDLENISDTAGVTFGEIKFVGEQVDDSEEGRLAQVEELPVGQEFSMQVLGNYSRIKDFLSLLEQNHYPLHVYGLDIESVEGGFLQAALSIVTYVDSSNDLNN